MPLMNLIFVYGHNELKQGSHSSWKIIEIQICFKIMEKSLNNMKSS